jgi:hypothetical protein
MQIYAFFEKLTIVSFALRHQLPIRDKIMAKIKNWLKFYFKGIWKALCNKVYTYTFEEIYSGNTSKGECTA